MIKVNISSIVKDLENVKKLRWTTKIDMKYLNFWLRSLVHYFQCLLIILNQNDFCITNSAVVYPDLYCFKIFPDTITSRI